MEQPTGTECGRCERRRLRRRVDTLQEAVMSRDRRIADLEAALGKARWTFDSVEKCKARMAELEAECERLAAENHRIGPYEPKLGRTLRFHNPRHVLVKGSGQCSVTHHLPEWLEVKL